MFILPKPHWNIKKNYYSNGNQFKRKICKGSLEIFVLMQIFMNFLADLCCILAVFKYKYLKIAATSRKLKECFDIIKVPSTEKRKC